MTDKIGRAMEASEKLGAKLGLKCVRGAYVNTERAIAKQCVIFE